MDQSIKTLRVLGSDFNRGWKCSARRADWNTCRHNQRHHIFSHFNLNYGGKCHDRVDRCGQGNLINVDSGRKTNILVEII